MRERLMQRYAVSMRAIDVGLAASIVALAVALVMGQASAAIDTGNPRTPTTMGSRMLGPDRNGVLVTARQSGTTPDLSGLWFVSVAGRVRQVLSNKSLPLARSASGLIAAFAAPDRTGPVTIIGAGTSALAGTDGAACVGWSSDGSRLTYITGEKQLIPRPGAQTLFGWLGTLWVVRTSAGIAAAQRVDDGFFPSAECPAWSASRNALAYIMRDPSGKLLLKVYDDQRSSQIATLDDAVPSTGYRTFAWNPGGSALAFISGNSLASAQGSWAPRPFGLSGALRAVETDGTKQGHDPAARTLSLSPNGRWLAASVAAATGIFRADGTLAKIVPGHLMGWSGNLGVLTERAGGTLEPTLFRYSLTSREPAVPLERNFKSNVLSDPSGHWFAYPSSKTPRILIFRRPNGRVLRRVSLPFMPFAMQAVSADGRMADPAGRY
jgi:hypothetical protein